MAKRSPDISGLDDRENQMEVFKALRDEISELQKKETEVDINLQELLNQQNKLIDKEQQSLTKLSDIKDELTLKKIQTKSLNDEINEARKQQENLYDELDQYNEPIEKKSFSNELNADLNRETDEECCLDEEHQLLLEQQEDIDKQIEDDEYKINIYQDDLESNEKQIEILQSHMKYLEQDLQDHQKKKESKDKDLSESRKTLIATEKNEKNDTEQLQHLQEKSAQLNYSKTFIEELNKNKRKGSDHIPARFKNELGEIDSRQKTIAKEIQEKDKEIQDLRKDSESITTGTTTTIGFTTNSTTSM
ncbi:unnamed protein product [Rotaria sp. Silwood1]|nr:unnamed protein product [Rotaria sp. Silwood1]CAF1655761.1 unnamed protein product [Rotaria sp. Silwood1]CAF3905619.1 unnamed protein product [Rotaria sp. Silwood1]CAF3919546.1 unnamed protein product [Rotaria sp. Silwood1]CAF3980965.1 unnamed protein product [Rotaria sp. Silwood1]